MDIVVAKELSLSSLEQSRVSLSRQCRPVNRPPNPPLRPRNRLVALRCPRDSLRVDRPPNRVVNPLHARRNNLSVNPPLNPVDNPLDNRRNNRLLLRVDSPPLNRVNRLQDRRVSSSVLLLNPRTSQQQFHPENRRPNQLFIQLHSPL
jgi:hypothetical protein